MAGGRDGAQQVPEHVHTTGLHQFKTSSTVAVKRNGDKWIADKGFGLPEAAEGVFRPTKAGLSEFLVSYRPLAKAEHELRPLVLAP